MLRYMFTKTNQECVKGTVFVDGDGLQTCLPTGITQGAVQSPDTRVSSPVNLI